MGCASLKGQVVDFAEEVSNAGFGGPRHTESDLQRFNRHHILCGKLGQGSFGSVYTAKRVGFSDEPELAVKVMDLRSPECEKSRASATAIEKARKKQVEKEAMLLKSMPATQSIVQFHGYYLDGPIAYLVMEKCDYTLVDLLQKMPSLNEESLKPVLRGMLAGIGACHSAGVAHRDIKADNFLVAASSPCMADFTIKLCDFGLAARVNWPEAQDLTGVHGTPPYMAPEMLVIGKHGTKVDIWAFGVFAYVMFYGRWPYNPGEYSSNAMKAAIATGTPAPAYYSRKGFPEISNKCAVWVRSLLRRCPADRPSAEEALETRAFTSAWNAEESLQPVLAAGIRMGAFHANAPGRTSKVDAKMKAMSGRLSSAQCQTRSRMMMSDDSTAAPSDCGSSP